VPRFIVETDEKNPEKVLLDAVKKIEKKNESFLEDFKKIRA
jgi:DNA-directed RNA polymerase subunit L